MLLQPEKSGQKARVAHRFEDGSPVDGDDTPARLAVVGGTCRFRRHISVVIIQKVQIQST
jgi:hypothetical protein